MPSLITSCPPSPVVFYQRGKLPELIIRRVLTKIITSQLRDSSRVLVKIEEDGKTHTFELSKEQVRSTSLFFKTAFKGGFLEAMTGTIVSI